MVTLRIKKLHKDAIIHGYAKQSDSGMDFSSIEYLVIFPGETKIVKTGLAVQLPLCYELQIRPRSGMSAKTKLRIANAPGTVDEGFRGEIGIIVDNIGKDPIIINKGDRIAQGVVMPVPQVKIIEVDFLTETERGCDGFGSSGV
jgi:dUTP pyrophosphatase